MPHVEPTGIERKREYYTAGLMSVDVEWEFDEELGPMKLIAHAWFKPGRSAPPCSDHDSPAFSDSGDPYEFEIAWVTVAGHGGHLAEMTWKDDGDFEEKVGELLDEQHTQDVNDKAFDERHSLD